MTETESNVQALTEFSPPPDWHRDIVRARLAEDDSDPESALPGEELLAWLRQPRA